MDAVIGGVLLVLFVLSIGPATRGTAAAIESIENQTRQETQEEHERANSDIARLLLLLVVVFGVLFAMKLGAL